MTDEIREAFRQLITATVVLDRETIESDTPAARGVQYHLEHSLVELLIAVDIWAAEAEPSS